MRSFSILFLILALPSVASGQRLAEFIPELAKARIGGVIHWEAKTVFTVSSVSPGGVYAWASQPGRSMLVFVEMATDGIAENANFEAPQFMTKLGAKNGTIHVKALPEREHLATIQKQYPSAVWLRTRDNQSGIVLIKEYRAARVRVFDPLSRKTASVKVSSLDSRSRAIVQKWRKNN